MINTTPKIENEYYIIVHGLIIGIKHSPIIELINMMNNEGDCCVGNQLVYVTFSIGLQECF